MAKETFRLITFNENIGKLSSLLAVFMAIGTLIVVLMRYVWGVGLIGLQEAVIYAFATLWWLCSPLTLSSDGHVRVDIFYRNSQQKTQQLINLLGHTFLLLPTSLCLIWLSWRYVGTSWSLKEGSTEPGGLPFLYLLKTLLLIGPGMLCIHAITLIALQIQQGFSPSK